MTSWPLLRAERTLYEDATSLVLDKPVGISVTGERHDTDLVRMAAAEGEDLAPAHRIDKVTSGVVLFAKSMPAHAVLTRQFQQRSVDKAYLAITRSTDLPEGGVIDLPLSVGRKSRVRIAAQREDIVHDEATGRWTVPEDRIRHDVRNYPSITTFRRLWADDEHALVLVAPLTGRRHQIRVHLAWIGHPIVGDPLFDRTGSVPRTALHAWRLGFDAVEPRPGADFWQPLAGTAPDADALMALADDQLTDLARLTDRR